MVYMTPTSIIAPQYLWAFGMFETIGSYHDLRKHGFAEWAGDNGRFWPKGTPDNPVNPNWTEAEWLKMLNHYPAEMRPSCRFMLVPDTPYNAHQTLLDFAHYLPAVVERGYPPAIATQNGMKPSGIPWSEIAAVFIGGDDNHKLGREGAAIAVEAHQRGKWVHVGRVNSLRRMTKHVWWAESVDGTMLARNSGLDRQRLLVEGVSFCRAKKSTRRLV